MKTIGFIGPITRLITHLLLFTNNKHQTQLQFCEYNIDCTLPKVCCRTPVFNYCCIRNDLRLQPIIIDK